MEIWAHPKNSSASPRSGCERPIRYWIVNLVSGLLRVSPIRIAGFLVEISTRQVKLFVPGLSSERVIWLLLLRRVIEDEVGATPEATAIRDDVRFFSDIRAALIKDSQQGEPGSGGRGGSEALDTAIAQIGRAHV